MAGGSIVVLDGDVELVKRPPEDLNLDDPLAYNMVMMLAGEDASRPHREMAVDVPDTFVARNKTPPRYPPPKPPVAVPVPVPPVAVPPTAVTAPQVRYDRLLGVQYNPEDQERAVDVPDSYLDKIRGELDHKVIFGNYKINFGSLLSILVTSDLLSGDFYLGVGKHAPSEFLFL